MFIEETKCIQLESIFSDFMICFLIISCTKFLNVFTSTEPILKEQVLLLLMDGAAELEQVGEGQSPQEQPSEVSLHE